VACNHDRSSHKELKDREAIVIANLVEQTWLTRYPWPSEIVFDRGTEFMGHLAQMIEEDYNLPSTTTRNPQADLIIERILWETSSGPLKSMNLI